MIPFAFGADDAFSISAGLTGLVFFSIGSIKARWSIAAWWWSGTVTFMVGGIAAVLAYLAVFFLKNLVP